MANEETWPDWVRRLGQERQQLQHKIDALEACVVESRLPDSTDIGRILLTQQLVFMKSYKTILDLRWERAIIKRAEDDLNEVEPGMAIPPDSSGMRDSHT